MSVEKARAHLLGVARNMETASDAALRIAVGRLIAECSRIMPGEAPAKPYDVSGAGVGAWVTGLERKAYLRGWKDGAAASRRAIRAAAAQADTDGATA